MDPPVSFPSPTFTIGTFPMLKPIKHKRKLHRIYVGGIPSSAKESELYHHFAQFGSILKIHTFQDDKQSDKSSSTGKIRGFCILDTKSLSTFKRILDFKGHSFQGRSLFCTKAKSGKELFESNQEINQRRALVKKVPAQLQASVIEKCITSTIGEVEKIYDFKSYDGRSISKNVKTYSVLFKNKEDLHRISYLKDGILSVGGYNVIVQHYDHEKRLESKTKPRIAEGVQHPYSGAIYPTRQSEHKYWDSREEFLESRDSDVKSFIENQAEPRASNLKYCCSPIRPSRRRYHEWRSEQEEGRREKSRESYEEKERLVFNVNLRGSRRKE